MKKLLAIVSIRGNQSCIGGLENGHSTCLKSEEDLLNDTTKALAGKAGVSLIYGVMDDVKTGLEVAEGCCQIH